jgi:nicotinamide riboside transporter PnuC
VDRTQIELPSIAAIAGIFAAAGAGVSAMPAMLFKIWNFFIGVVFALLCWVLFWRSRRIVLVGPLIVLIWLAAFGVTLQ